MLSNLPLFIFLLSFQIGIITYPAARALRAKNVSPFSSRGLKLLTSLILITIMLVLIEEYLGLTNPLGLILANSVGVSLIGYYYVKKVVG